MSVTICCEGPECNNGRSAVDREAAIIGHMPTATQELRDEAAKQARSLVTHILAVTPHGRVGVNRRGYALFACEDCGFERTYGSTMMVGY